MKLTRRTLFAAGAAAPLLPSLAGAQARWQMATPYPDGNFHTRNNRAFIEAIQTATSGRVQVQLHSNASLLPMAQIKRGQVSADEMRRLQMATDKVRHLPISVHATCTIEEIEGQVLASKARKGEELGLVVVDYLGLIPATQGIDDRGADNPLWLPVR